MRVDARPALLMRELLDMLRPPNPTRFERWVAVYLLAFLCFAVLYWAFLMTLVVLNLLFGVSM